MASSSPNEQAADTIGTVPDCEATDAASIDAELVEEGPVTDGAEVAAQPTTDITGTGFHKERFIPVTRFALKRELLAPAAWPDGRIDDVAHLFTCIEAIRNLTYTRWLLNMKEAYLPFSPDRDTVRALKFTAAEMATNQHRMIDLLTRCLEGANYERITPDMLEEILDGKSEYGLDLDVDLEEFDEVLIYARGATVKVRLKRSWKSLWLRKYPINVPIFQRLFLLLKLKPEEARVDDMIRSEDCTERKARRCVRRKRQMIPDHVQPEYVFLKLFKQIPRADLQMMFPNTRVKFKLKDKLFLGATAGGGTIASIVSTAGKIALIASNPIKALGALVGLIGVIFRQIMKFFNQKNQYMMTLAQNLYFHNLADNRGVLTLLADRAEEEDVKEDLLLYALLVRGPLPRNELGDAREAIEAFLAEKFNVNVAFDVHDALKRLMHDNLVREDSHGTLRTLDPKDAAVRLTNKWAQHLVKPDEHATDTLDRDETAKPSVAAA